MTGMWWKHSDVFLRQLRDTFKTVNFIGIRILEGRDVNSFIKRYIDDFDQQNVSDELEEESFLHHQKF